MAIHAEPPCPGSTPKIAYVLRSMEAALEIHAAWAVYLKAHPGYDARLGSVAWHLDWVERYKATMQVICDLDQHHLTVAP